MNKWKLPTFDFKKMMTFDHIVILGWFALLFLILINYLFLINHIIILLIIYTAIYAIIYQVIPKLSISLIVLTLFGGVYFYFYSRYNLVSPRIYMIYLVGPSLMFLVGMIFQHRFKDKMFRSILLMIAFGFFIYGALNMVYYIMIYGWMGEWRVAVEFWTGYDVVATLQGVYFTAISSLLFYNLVFLKIRKHLFVKLLMIIAIFFGLYSSVMLQNRTLFIITALMLVLMFLLEVVLSKGRLIKPTMIVVGFLGLLYLGYTNNILDIKTYVEESTWYERATTTIEEGILNDPRIPIYQLTYDQFFDHLYGGYQMDINELDYAHNLWIDVLYVGGIYPFVLLLLYTLMVLYTALRIIFSRKIPKENKILYTSILIGLLINFMTEPILDGVPYVFLVFCLMNGVAASYYKNSYVKKIKVVQIEGDAA